MGAWPLLITRAVIYSVAGVEAALAILGLAANDLSYLWPMTIVGAAGWLVTAVCIVANRRQLRREHPGWN